MIIITVTIIGKFTCKSAQLVKETQVLKGSIMPHMQLQYP